MSGLAMAAAFENVEEAGEIGVEISVRVLQRVANAGLGGEMHHRAEIAVAKKALDVSAFGEIDFMEGKFVEFAQDVQPRLLQRRIVIIVDIIETDDRLATLKEAARQRKTDKSRSAGNQDGILRHRHSRC